MTNKMKGLLESDMFEDLFRFIHRVTQNQENPVRLLLGPYGTVLSRVALTSPRATGKFLTFQRALAFRLQNRDSISMEWLKEAERDLRKALAASSANKKELKEAIEELDRLVKFHEQLFKYRHLSPAPSINAPLFKRLDRIIDRSMMGMKQNSDELMIRYEDFKAALRSKDPQKLEKAALKLKEVIGPSCEPNPKVCQEIRRDIERLTSDVLKTQKSGDAQKILAAIEQKLDALSPDDPIRKMFKMFLESGTLSNDTKRWNKLLKELSNLNKADNPNYAQYLIWKIKGDLGEIFAFNMKAYRKLWEEQLDRARQLAFHPVPPMAGEGWKVCPVRSTLKARTKKGSFGLFYDDAIFLVRETPDKKREAIVLFASQVKSGDSSSKKIVAQIKKDIEREPGIVEIDGQIYELVPGPKPVRAFIGTSLPDSEPQQSITFIPLPASSDQMDALSEFLLLAAGKL